MQSKAGRVEEGKEKKSFEDVAKLAAVTLCF